MRRSRPEALRDRLGRFPQARVAHLPTPLHPLRNLTAHLDGPNLWAKRDDLTGLGTGGNKLRKIEFALAEAMEAGADCIVSGGVIQSNSARQVAAACAAAGLPCHLAVFEGRVAPKSDRYHTSGNAVLASLFGAVKHPRPWSETPNAVLEQIAADLRRQGHTPAILPYGVSNAIGAIGYASVVAEIGEQMDTPPAAIVFATGSGGTQAGIAIGCDIALPDTQAIGFDIDAAPERVKRDAIRIARDAATRLNWTFDEAKIDVRSGMAGPAYGVPHPACLDALRIAGRLEGLVLDPTYSAKSLAGLIALIEKGEFQSDDHIVFIHSGGDAAVFAYHPDDLGIELT